MFSAIDKVNNKLVNSYEIEFSQLYPFPKETEWIANISYIDNWEEIKDKFPDGIKCSWIPLTEMENYAGTKWKRLPYFRIDNATKLGINICQETKEHKLAKVWIYNRIKNKDDLKIIYSSVNKPYKYDNYKYLNDFNFDYSLFDCETNINNFNKKRVDVICPFIKWDKFFGRGIVFEIQFSKQKEKTTNQRTYERIDKGYSVVWINREDFEILNDEEIKLKKDELKLNVFEPICKETLRLAIRDSKGSISKELQLLDSNINEYKNEFNELNNNISIKKELLNKQINNEVEIGLMQFRREHKQLIEKAVEQIKPDITKKIDNTFFEENKIEINRIINENINSILKNKIEFEIKEQIKNKILNVDFDEIRKEQMKIYLPLLNERKLLENPRVCNDCNFPMELRKSKNEKGTIYWWCQICHKPNGFLSPLEKEMLFNGKY